MTGSRPTVFYNDGAGVFTAGRDFTRFYTPQIIALGDLDDDQDLDLIVNASNQSFIFWNDCNGNFNDSTASFQVSDQGEFQIADVNGDSINDVLQTGLINNNDPFTAIWINDGSGSFTRNDLGNERKRNNFVFIDLEGDKDLDIVSFGQSTLSNADSVIIYKNDGTGQFSIFENSNIEAHLGEGLSVGDVDNDGDDDLLVTGTKGGSATTILYINDGNGQFSKLLNAPFPNVFSSSTALADFDNDDDLDVLIIGSGEGGGPNIFSIVYENQGGNIFDVADSLIGEYIPTNTIADFNGDDRLDIIIQGHVANTSAYWNETDIMTSAPSSEISELALFPNPSANGVFRLSESRDWTVYSLNGTKLNSDESSVVDLSNENAGVYLLQMDDVVYRLIKE